MKLATPLKLPCGLELKNRIAKAAMSEMLTRTGDPNDALLRLYQRFTAGGAGLVITGNMMVDRDHREHPRNVIVDDRTSTTALAQMAATGKGTALVAQLCHPGRQALLAVPGPVAPSTVTLKLPSFRPPRALGTDEIAQVVQRFAHAAKACEDAGFAGVELHAAHGYLVSQFLSPLTNLRTDAYGGSLENRARFLLEVVAAVRARVKSTFAFMIKLNSADFQRGGFADNDALAVIRLLDGTGVDLLEISGGSYEAPAMVGGLRESTRQREAYFLEFAERARAASGRIPLMVTGGFRTPAAMEAAVATGAVDVVGLARPLAFDPDFAARVLAGDPSPAALVQRDKIGVRLFDSILSSQLYVEQMHRLAKGKAGDPTLSRVWTIAHMLWMRRVG